MGRGERRMWDGGREEQRGGGKEEIKKTSDREEGRIRGKRERDGKREDR